MLVALDLTIHEYFFLLFYSLFKILILKLFSCLLLFLGGVYYICEAEIAQLVEQRTRNA